MLEGHSADEHLVTVLIDFYIISSLFNLSTIYYFSSTLRCKSIRSFIYVLMFFWQVIEIQACIYLIYKILFSSKALALAATWMTVLSLILQTIIPSLLWKILPSQSYFLLLLTWSCLYSFLIARTSSLVISSKSLMFDYDQSQGTIESNTPGTAETPQLTTRKQPLTVESQFAKKTSGCLPYSDTLAVDKRLPIPSKKLVSTWRLPKPPSALKSTINMSRFVTLGLSNMTLHPMNLPH